MRKKNFSKALKEVLFILPKELSPQYEHYFEEEKSAKSEKKKAAIVPSTMTLRSSKHNTEITIVEKNTTKIIPLGMTLRSTKTTTNKNIATVNTNIAAKSPLATIPYKITLRSSKKNAYCL